MGGKKKAKSKKKSGGDTQKSEVSSMEQMAYKMSSLESQLEDAKDRVKHLTHENEELRRNREKVEKDTHEFVAYFQKEMEKKDDLIADLRYNLRQTEVAREREIRELRDTLTRQIETKDSDHASTERELRLQVNALQEELNVLQDFKAHKKELESRLRDQEHAMLAKDADAQRSIADAERKLIEEKARQQKEHERQLARIKKKSREEALKGLDADTRRIITDNRRMGEELRFQLKTTDELQVSKEATEEENKALKREVALYHEKEKEYAKGGHRRAREIKELTVQVQTLERSLGQVVRDFERDRDRLVQGHKEESEELSLEVSGLRKLIKLKNKELRTIRKLAQTILGQRTEVERFFLDALSQVKDEISTARAEYRKKGTMWDASNTRSPRLKNVKFPALGGSGRGTPRSDDGGGKVDLGELSLEDRERVLRLLFAKINNVNSYAGTFDQEPEPQDMIEPMPAMPAMPAASAAPAMVHHVDIPLQVPALPPATMDDDAMFSGVASALNAGIV